MRGEAGGRAVVAHAATREHEKEEEEDESEPEEPAEESAEELRKRKRREAAKRKRAEESSLADEAEELLRAPGAVIDELSPEMRAALEKRRKETSRSLSRSKAR